MELSSGKPEVSYQVDTDGARKLCKVIIVKALRDLGTGVGQEREQLWKWLRSDSFETIRTWAGWGDDWVLDLFSSVYHLSPSVRSKITRDCVVMLKRFGDIE